jgi:hypothetical protein
MSIDRIRVARSDWCPSRIVVSVTRTWRWFSIHSASAAGPNSSRICRVPARGVSVRTFGGFGSFTSAAGRGRPAVSGCPFTVMSAM